MQTPLEVLSTAMKQTGPWHGPKGAHNHNAFDVLFAAEQHLRKDVDRRAAEWLANRRTGSSVAWLRLAD